MSIQKSEIVSDLGKGETQDLWICVFRLSMSFGKINSAKANLLGQLFGFLYVGVSVLCNQILDSMALFLGALPFSTVLQSECKRSRSRKARQSFHNLLKIVFHT